MSDPISAWAALESDDQRRHELALHPELLRPITVKELCDRVVAELRTNLDAAEQLAKSARFLAGELADDYCRGRSCRALSIVCIQRRDYPTALSYAEEALEHFKAVGDDLEAAITRSSNLHGLVHLGFHERALEWAKAAEDTFRRLGDHLRLARLRFNVGTLLARQDRFGEALGHYRSAHRTFLAIGRAQDVGTSLRNIAVCLQCDHQLEEALEGYHEARAYCEQNELSLLVLEIDYNIAYLHYLRGEYGIAIELFELGRVNCEQLGDRQHMALCDLDLSEIYLELNLVGEAAHLAERGRQEFESLEMGYEVAKCLTNLALSKGRIRETDQALSLLDQARNRFLEENNTIWAALIDLYRSQILAAAGHSDESVALAERALSVFDRHDLPARVARCEIHLARLALRRGAAEQARSWCTSALSRFESFEVPAFEYRIWALVGEIEEHLGRPEAAVEAFWKAESTLERLRSHLQTDELKISFLEDKSEIYEGLVWLGFEHLGAEPQLIFETIERAKSRGLADLLAVRVDTIRAKSGSDEKVVELRKLRRDLNGSYRQLDLLEVQGDSKPTERVEKLRQLIRKNEDRLVRILRKLQRSDRELSSLQQGMQPSLEGVQAVLPAGSVLLEYFLARGRVFACLVQRSGIEVFNLGSSVLLEERMRAFRFQLSKMLLDPTYVATFQATLQQHIQVRLKDLYDLLIPPAVSRLSPHHLIVVPHGPLHYLPFHALFDGVQYLIDRFSISYSPSAGVYGLCRNRPPSAGRGALVLGVADERAPLILKEAETVANALPEARLFVGSEADEQNLRRFGAEARYVHLAAHGDFRRDHPMFSSIQLGGGRLNLFDLYNLELDADLAVLSGCGTGLSDVRQGDELVGLTRGLLYAGARTVAVSLWDVNDETTTELMGAFYSQLGQGLEPAEALRRAMAKLRKEYAHPYYWAPFVLIGDAFGDSVAGETVTEGVVGVEPTASSFLG